MIRCTCSLLAMTAALAAQAPLPAGPVPARPVPTGPAPTGPIAAAQATPAATLPSAAPSTPAPAGANAIDLVICLDTSGSMSGLINAARQNLWSVVNDLATLKPQPELRVALLTFGSPAYGDHTGFVAVQTGLTSDLDLVSQKLFELGTNGGSEYVARVVRRALDDLEWAPHPKALKLLFVAGNESALQDPKLDTLEQSRAAIQRGVLVNTIYCGPAAHGDAAGWQNVATLADGRFASIDKDQAVVIETPFDKQIAELSASLNTTYVPYGDQGGHWAANQVAQDGNAAGLNLACAAQRGQSKAGALYSNPTWDLVDACRDAKFELSKIEKKTLPKELQGLTTAQLQQHVDAMAKQRGALQQQIVELGKQRDAFVVEERKKLAKAGDKVFEEAVLESVRDQARARGFERAPEPAKSAAGNDEVFEAIIEKAAAEYREFVRVTGSPKVAPTMCRIPGPFARVSAASREHGGKLYLLYVRDAKDGKYVVEGQPAAVGQTLVKESWERVEGAQQGQTEASVRYPLGLTMHDGDRECHAGDSYGLFVMHKLASDTPGTDQGWIYGTVDKLGQVTAAGRIASCIKCHQGADNDRRFGLD